MRKLIIVAYILFISTLLVDAGTLFNYPQSVPTTGNGVVVSNAPGCAQIGRDIMKKGGNAVDTIIATAICEGVVNPSTNGIGGGFLATLYIKSSGNVYSFNARETAPSRATEDMFKTNPSLSGSGGLSVAIPSEIRGYWDLYNKWGGKLPWFTLLEPTISLCEEGITMNDLTYRNAKDQIKVIRADPVLKEIFINPKTDDVYQYGELYRRPKLAETLRIIGLEGGDSLYSGLLGKSLAKDIQDEGGIISAEDLENYKTEILEPVHTEIAGKDLYSIPLPGSGTILNFILNVLENDLDVNDQFTTVNYQRITEALKYAYGMRSKLGDANFVQGADKLVSLLLSKSFASKVRALIKDNATSSQPDYYGSYTESSNDHGTANLCVWGPNGDGVALTSSINYVFGAGFASKSTGIILNNSMDDFSSPGITNVYGLPPTPANFIKPGKRPLSSMSPSIILNKDKNLYMVIGGAGGSKITSSVAQVILNRLYFNRDIKTASDLKRIHHQLLPMTLFMEDEWLIDGENVVEDLKKIGHNITFTANDGFVAVTTISVNDGIKSAITGVHDKRRLGSVAYL